MKQDIQIIRKSMCAAGAEAATAAALQQILRPFCDKLYTDTLGNLIAYKKGSGEGRLMLSVGMDLSGVIVTTVAEGALVRVEGVGGAEVEKLNFQTLRFENGARGVFYTDANAKQPSFKDAYVDIEKNEKVSAGKCATVEADLRIEEDQISGFGAANAACLAAVCQVFKKTQRPRCDLYAVFAVQQKVSGRGTAVASAAIQPTVCISVEPTAAGGYGGAPKKGVVKVGQGISLRIRDAKTVADARLVEQIETAAKKKTIPLQREVLAEGTSAVAGVPYTVSGARVAALSLPTMFYGSAAERIALCDLQACTEILQAVLAE